MTSPLKIKRHSLCFVFSVFWTNPKLSLCNKFRGLRKFKLDNENALKVQCDRNTLNSQRKPSLSELNARNVIGSEPGLMLCVYWYNYMVKAKYKVATSLKTNAEKKVSKTTDWWYPYRCFGFQNEIVQLQSFGVTSTEDVLKMPQEWVQNVGRECNYTALCTYTDSSWNPKHLQLMSSEPLV